MRKFIFIMFIFSCSMMACKKDTTNTPDPKPVPVIPPDYKIKFVFVNRTGFRSDSTRHGINDTVFQGLCIDSKFYDKSKNMTYAANTCYNRNYAPDNFPLADSITFRTYNSAIGSMYGYQVELIWKCPTYPYTTKGLRYNTVNFNSGDTIKISKDTIIKFIWPDDTASGRFIKTYKYP